MTQTAKPAMAGVSEAYFASTDGLQLFMSSIVPERPKAAVLVLHGYADHGQRYRHVMEAFSRAGYASFALDYRGHGRAEGRRGYVAKFDDYLGDVRTALARIRARYGEIPLFIVGHSHGALVACTLLSRSDAPDVAGVVLSSPYFRLKIEPRWWELAAAKVLDGVAFARLENPLRVDQLTHDDEMRRLTEADTLRHSVVTPRWFNESNAAQAALFRAAPGFQWPLLVMQGGQDPVADPEGGRAFVTAAGSKDKRFTMYEGMLHEIFNEVERDKPIAEAIDWMDAHMGSGR